MNHESAISPTEPPAAVPTSPPASPRGDTEARWIPMDLRPDQLDALVAFRKRQHRVVNKPSTGTISVGDAFFVREPVIAWVDTPQSDRPRSTSPMIVSGSRVFYADHPRYHQIADQIESQPHLMNVEGGSLRRIPPALMPAWAARRVAVVTSVTIESLLDISTEDAAEEMGWPMPRGEADRVALMGAMMDMWNASNDEQYRWVTNPQVVACKVRYILIERDWVFPGGIAAAREAMRAGGGEGDR